ncbi:site-specific DNA-methyltransferase [uncultured Selenomonas sp.]|uniref:site-specific DNA-methyltransferase n=1 Tax=uncultured Selenomonas sp. TaxID=159275 RepID=UPI0028D8237C|nr:site-specific DNA-methyltransferase [uncultured Selenomonas sp.]
MDKLEMHTRDLTEENFQKLAALFPNAVTETAGENGEVVRAIDADVLRQEISAEVVEGTKERYQFNWPDKKKSVVLANQPIAKTLRLLREKSTGRDGTPGSIDTENIYIEGDNLDALKLLQETYLGKVKLIYIDPPYNTGGDAFVYDDDFAVSGKEFEENSGAVDADGNRLFDLRENNESNGRFHTDWLNMIYPRLRLAKDLLADDGVIFISIGDEELENLRKVCDEIFGEVNFRNQITIRRGAKSLQAQFDSWDKLGQSVEYILLYTRNSEYRFPKQMKPLDEKRAGTWNNHWRGTDRPTMRYELFGYTPKQGQWRWSKERSYQAVKNYQRMLLETGQEEGSFVPTEIVDKWYAEQGEDIDLLRLSSTGKAEHYIASANSVVLNNSWVDLLVGSSNEINQLFENKVFETAKLTETIKRMLRFATKDAIILDFFSGSATTAHAVMKLNAEDGGHRKFIMVQIPEPTADKSEAKKAGYDTICDIGEERIRRAAKKIKEETNADIDYGFRVFKIDSSNMKDVYYRPQDLKQEEIVLLADNIKEDRTPEDLLFQVMLDLGVLLSSKIEEKDIAGKKVFTVEDGYLIACFDKDVTEEVVTAIAKEKPFYAVFRDSGMATDALMANFEQIFETHSPQTVRKVL